MLKHASIWTLQCVYDRSSFAKFQGAPSPLAAIHAQPGGALAIQVGGHKTFNGKKCAVVSATGTLMEFYVNQTTKLLEGISIPGNVEMTFEDYKSVGGVQFAGKSTVKIDAQNMTMVYEYKTTKLNGKIDDAKFKKPSSHSAPKPAQPSSESFTAKQIISFMDKNGDGKIAKNEASDELKPNFQFIDTNGDGAIDLKEAEVMTKYAASSQPTSTAASVPAPKRTTAKQILSSMDTDGNGRISKDEASEDLKLFFGDIDTNGDGTIDVKEAEVMAKYVNEQQTGTTQPTAAPTRVSAQQIVESMDANDDGKISKEEASEDLKPYFGQQDANGDGVIDVKEAQVIADYVNSLQGQ